jgi:hypothetical protein
MTVLSFGTHNQPGTCLDSYLIVKASLSSQLLGYPSQERTNKGRNWEEKVMDEREREREKHAHTHTHTHTHIWNLFCKKIIAAQQPKYVPNKILSGCRVYNFDTLTSLPQRSGAKLWWLAKVLFWSISRMQALFGVFSFFLFFSCQRKNSVKTIT